jgi:hypothetical protein
MRDRCGEREGEPRREQQADRRGEGLDSGYGGFRHAGLSFAGSRRAEYIGVIAGCR